MQKSVKEWKTRNLRKYFRRRFRVKEAGGKTIVDVTSNNIGSDPAVLVRIAQTAGINVITGTSYYFEASYYSEMRVGSKTAKDIADEFVRDI